ncbi:MAG TPA: zinc ribbon domain-containing protein [Chloroflexi bacterium]|nr:zinc ribbon domain-containing protein [Chloroflexota bacterium]
MPIYEYRCRRCGEEFEKLVRSLSAQEVVTCPRCGSEEVEKAISLFGLGNSARSSAGDSCSSGSV